MKNYERILYIIRRYKNDVQNTFSLIPQWKEKNRGYGLKPSQFYPYRNEFKKYFVQYKLKESNNIARHKRISSIGTCFAEEIASFFKRESLGLTYLTLEDNIYDASANWGRVYTSLNLLQIIKYSFDDKFPYLIEKINKKYFDLLREKSVGQFENRNYALKATTKHRELSRKVFSESDYLIITLGQNEGWLYTEDQIMIGAIPDQDWFLKNKAKLRLKEISFHENYNYLKEVINILLDYNPNIKLIFTISPVPAYATFVSQNVVIQSMAYKSILRSVVHEIEQEYENKIIYFPSYEIVMCNNNSYLKDNRHIRFNKVSEIFNLFKSSIK